MRVRQCYPVTHGFPAFSPAMRCMAGLRISNNAGKQENVNTIACVVKQPSR
jgi:hypothetical protein